MRPVLPAVAALLVLACRPSPAVQTAPVPSASGAPAPGGPLAVDGVTPSAPMVLPPTEKPAAVLVARVGDDVGRTAAAVFGDSIVATDSTDADEPSWDMDVRSYETHERVAHYVNLFSNSARDRFVTRLSRGTRYEPMIRAKLRAGGLPEDMIYLALIESGFDPDAYSRAAAVGMWQFMSSTARDVGMRVDWWIDERRDPARATDGAIRFLRDLQEQFGGSLYLAAAAYNGGPGRVSRGLSRFAEEMDGSAGEDRFFALAEQDYLRAETKNYVPQLIAAALVAKMPTRYGLRVDTAAAYAYDSVRTGAATSLAAVSAAGGLTVAELRELNPAILRGITPPDAPYWVKVPVGTGERTAAALDALPDATRRGFTSRTVSGKRTTLGSLAADAGVTPRELAAFNPGLRVSKGRLVSGQTVRIPARDALAFARDIPDPSIERYGTSDTRTATRGAFHVVRRGETLGGVARKYGLSVARLKSLNRIRGARLIAGQTLRVKGAATTASRTTAVRGSSSKARSSKASTSKSSRSAKAATSKSSTAKSAKAKVATSKSAKSAKSKSAKSAKSAKSTKSSTRASTATRTAAKKPAARKAAGR